MKKQKSESLEIMVILTLVGGFLDSYSYITRDGVFAFAQTGNLVLLSMNLVMGNYHMVLRYLLPIISFLIGTSIVRIFEKNHKHMKILHWRQVVLIFEIMLLFIVGFIPKALNNLACLMISFVCAIQIETFRRFNGVDLMTTMCTGNLKKATDKLIDFLYLKDLDLLKGSLTTYSAILIFIFGCGIGTLTSEIFDYKSILLLPGILVIAFFIMHDMENSRRLRKNK